MGTGRAQGTEESFDDDFYVDDDGESLILDNRSGEKGYVTLVTWKAGSGMPGGTVKDASGSYTVSKDSVDRVTVYRMEAIAQWEGGIFRPCDPPDIHDCPIPIPPPPPFFDAVLHRPRP